VIQRVEVSRYIPVPVSLTAPCEVDATQRTVGDALERVPRLEACVDDLNARMKDVRELKPPY
jgi:hypothetical protein